MYRKQQASSTMTGPPPPSTPSPLARFTFPRTGKRGVPQQFPRRLYEMLDCETRQVEASPEYRNIISWSDSGKAFRIFDVTEFSASILPKYFRTRKFSSFQRNLNLVSQAEILIAAPRLWLLSVQTKLTLHPPPFDVFPVRIHQDPPGHRLRYVCPSLLYQG